MTHEHQPNPLLRQPSENAANRNFTVSNTARRPVTAKLHNRKVFFHGVNKSGSLAMATVLHAALAKAGRDQNFICRYFGGISIDAALERFSRLHEGLLVDHGLVGRHLEYRNSTYITMLRDPVKRMFSCYYWLLTHHPEKVYGMDFLNWIKTQGRHYAQVRQFAFNHSSPSEKARIVNMPMAEQIQRAQEFFKQHIMWFGITELFEESIFSLSFELQLSRIQAWKKDERNKRKPAFTSIPNRILEEIEGVIGHDIAFYEMKKQEFLSYFANFDFGGELLEYKAVCPLDGNQKPGAL